MLLSQVLTFQIDQYVTFDKQKILFSHYESMSSKHNPLKSMNEFPGDTLTVGVAGSGPYGR